MERLRSISDPLPPVATEAALECRLEAEDSRVDFEACIRVAGGGRRRLAEALGDPAVRGAASRSAGWRRALAFLRAWTAPDSPLHLAIAVVWLEFDVSEDGSSSEPFLVFTLDPEHFYASGRADPAALDAILDTGLGLLADGLDRPTAQAVSRCVKALPPTGQLLHAAVRPTAAGDIARLIVRMPWREILATLERLDWPGSIAELRSLLERLCARAPVHSINLDVAERLGPRLGIEFHYPGNPGDDPRWKALFDDLEEAGACTPEKRQILEEWTSGDAGRAPEPGSIHAPRALMVKIVYEPGAALRAKAYLPFGPRLALG